MTTGIRSNADGSKSYIQVGGTDRITIDAATGKLTSTYSPPTGERSLALATMQKFADEFGSSLATSGYQKLPSGLIIQWGIAPDSNNITVTGSFPITFPNSVLLMVGSQRGVTVQPQASAFTTISTAQYQYRSAGGSSSVGASYIAIGY